MEPKILPNFTRYRVCIWVNIPIESSVSFIMGISPWGCWLSPWLVCDVSVAIPQGARLIVHSEVQNMLPGIRVAPEEAESVAPEVDWSEIKVAFCALAK